MSKTKSPPATASRGAKKTGPKSDQADLGTSFDLAHLPLELRIGAVIKRRRLAANLTLSDLSTGAGLSSGHDCPTEEVYRAQEDIIAAIMTEGLPE